MNLMEIVFHRGQTIAWWFVRQLHAFDFKHFLPLLAKLPLIIAYPVSAFRGYINGLTGRDWRSVALGFRHIRRQSLEGYKHLPTGGSAALYKRWSNERFAAEAREEFEARLVVAHRVEELKCTFKPTDADQICRLNNSRGLMLLTLHFDSFFVGAAFLARSGATINFMSSSVTHDPRVDAAVQDHFDSKYRGLERYLNDGSIVNMEDGLRPFYRMLERHETLIVLGDAPAVPNGVSMTVEFLGHHRKMAGGALRLAERTGSDIGGYLCHHRGGGHYELEVCRIGPASDPASIQHVYDFFSDAITKDPGLWWAVDLLPDMTKAG
jgi:lauroyl/myristoyl acyltransferase